MPTPEPEMDAPRSFEPRLEELCGLWGAPEIAPRIRVELSTRMTRSLGRAYPERRLIRIAAPLLRGPAPFLDEVLCHEAAHIVVFEKHGRAAKPHGAEWKNLMQVAGFEPATRLRVPEGIPGMPRVAPPRRRRRRRKQVLRWGRIRISFEKLGR